MKTVTWTAICCTLGVLWVGILGLPTVAMLMIAGVIGFTAWDLHMKIIEGNHHDQS